MTSHNSLSFKSQYFPFHDHGNCDIMKNSDGSPNTAHTTNMVPIIVVDKQIKKVNDGILGDIAPTVLDLMNIDKPKLMTGKSLIS